MGLMASKPPPVSPEYALGGSVAIAVGFVGLMYALPTHVRFLPRDHPTHVRYRIIAAMVACVLAPLPLLVHKSAAAWKWRPDWANLLGVALECNTPAIVLQCLLWMLLLFAGPLLEIVIFDLPLWDVPTSAPAVAVPDDAAHTDVYTRLLPRLRDLVVAPVAEEWVFRCCTLPLLALAGFSQYVALAAGAGAFGLAHVHHYLEFRRQGYALEAALMRAVVVFSYTSVFAAMAGFAFWRTGSALGVVLMHAFCNSMGLPRFSFLRSSAVNTPQRTAVAAVYVAGIVGFCWMAASVLQHPNVRSPCAPTMLFLR